MNDKRKKSRAYTSYERLMFVDILIPYGQIIESGDRKAKQQTWTEVKDNFNQIAETGHRDETELRSLYETLKKQFRRDLTGFGGDVNLMFTHPEIEESRKELNKKLWSVCTESLQWTLNGSFVNKVLAETRFQTPNGQSTEESDTESLDKMEPEEIVVKTEIPTDLDEIPLPSTESEQPQIRVKPALSGFSQPTTSSPKLNFSISQPTTSSLNFSGSQSTTPSPKLNLSITSGQSKPQVRIISRAEFEEKKKMLSAGKLAGYLRPAPERKDLNNSLESEPPNKKPRIVEDEEKMIRLDILRIQRSKAEIERDILMVELEKKKLELEQFRKSCQ